MYKSATKSQNALRIRYESSIEGTIVEELQNDILQIKSKKEEIEKEIYKRLKQTPDGIKGIGYVLGLLKNIEEDSLSFKQFSNQIKERYLLKIPASSIEVILNLYENIIDNKIILSDLYYKLNLHIGKNNEPKIGYKLLKIHKIDNNITTLTEGEIIDTILLTKGKELEQNILIKNVDKIIIAYRKNFTSKLQFINFW